MLKKNSLWLIVLVSVMAVAFLAAGCAKKQVMKEEAAAKPAMAEKKAAPKPPPKMEPPKAEAKPAPMPAPAPVKEAPVPMIDLTGLRIQFAFDDYSLSNQAKENLEKLSAWMMKVPVAAIQIEGHACEIGTNEYNLALGERRANSAKMYLEGLGIPKGRVSTISYGEERPLDPGHTEAARSKNRRDEFVRTK